MFGKPIVFGPHMQNFQEIAEAFLANGAAVQVQTERELKRRCSALVADPVRRARLGAAARALVEANRGAKDKTLAVIGELLPLATAGTGRAGRWSVRSASCIDSDAEPGVRRGGGMAARLVRARPVASPPPRASGHQRRQSRVGGSGKTPIVAYIARLLLRARRAARDPHPRLRRARPARRRDGRRPTHAVSCAGLRRRGRRAADARAGASRRRGARRRRSLSRRTPRRAALRAPPCTSSTMAFSTCELARDVDLLLVAEDDLHGRPLPAGRSARSRWTRPGGRRRARHRPGTIDGRGPDRRAPSVSRPCSASRAPPARRRRWRRPRLGGRRRRTRGCSPSPASRGPDGSSRDIRVGRLATWPAPSRSAITTVHRRRTCGGLPPEREAPARRSC